MADITMCKNKKCDDRFTCYRFLANANPYRQSYFASVPKKENDKCVQYVNAKS